MNRLNNVTRTQIVHSLCEGMSQRSCERIFGVSNKTVAKLFEDAGDMSIAYMSRLRDLPIRNIQADEIHSFVGVKQAHLPEAANPVDGAGTVWAFLAVCADSKLIFDYHVGDRGLPDAAKFAKSMVSKLRRTDRGDFAVRPLIVTDGHRPYYEAFEAAVGSDADRAVLIKRYNKLDANGEPMLSSRYVGSDRIVVCGTPAISDIHTSYIERQNLNLRMGNRRYNRRTNAFSKTLLNHQRHLALWIMYHNLCWVPRPHRPRPDKNGVRPNRWEKRLPAAIAAGVEKRLWEVKDLLALTDAHAKTVIEPSVPAVVVPPHLHHRLIGCIATKSSAQQRSTQPNALIAVVDMGSEVVVPSEDGCLSNRLKRPWRGHENWSPIGLTSAACASRNTAVWAGGCERLPVPSHWRSACRA